MSPDLNPALYIDKVYVDLNQDEWIVKSNIKNKNNWYRIKPARDCENAQKYFSQFSNSKENYNLREIKILLKKVSFVLRNNQIYIVYTGWDSIWTNSDYSKDCAGEFICNKYSDLVNERFDNLKKIMIGYKKYYNMPLLYMRDLVSFLVISDNDLYLSKINGILHIQTNFINSGEKIQCIKILREVFSNRLIIGKEYIDIKLYKN